MSPSCNWINSSKANQRNVWMTKHNFRSVDESVALFVFMYLFGAFE